MKRTLLIFVVVVLALAVGYFVGTVNAMMGEKFAIIGNTIGGDENLESRFGDGDSRESFDSFIHKFIADSVFQLERIQFPLKTLANVETGSDAGLIKKQDWKIVRLFGNHGYRSQIYDNFKKEMRDTNERLFCWEGVENGVYVEYRFIRVNGRWFLTEYNDFSD